MPKARIPETIHLPCTFHAKRDHIVAVFQIGESTIGIRFDSPEHLLYFMSAMMDKAALTWPEDEWVKEWNRK